MKKSLLFIALAFGALLSNAQRKVLIEQFTNSGCPPCAANTPFIANYVATDTNAIMLSYHTSFPYLDSMYFENPAQSNQRVSYYGVSGVPTARVDGNYFSGNILPTISTTISARKAMAPKYNIEITTNNLSNNTIHISANLTSLDAANANDNLQAMIVVTEKKVLKSSYLASPGANSEQEYPWVVRRVLPDEFGTALINKTLNGVDQVTTDWSISSIKNINELYVVLYVQNTTTKEIYQAEVSKTNSTNGINDLHSKNNLVRLAPSVVTNELNIQLLEVNQAQLAIVNIIGEKVDEFNMRNQNSWTSRNLSALKPGIYFLTCESENSRQVLRFVKN